MNQKGSRRRPGKSRRGGGKHRRFKKQGGGGKHRGERKRNVPPLVSVDSLERGPLARHRALELLCEADDKSLFIDHLLEQRASIGRLEPRDRYLVQEMAYGAIRHRSTLDHVLDGYIQFSMRRHDLPLRWGLRLAAYQLIYLSRIPSHAAIHGTLEAMKAAGGLLERDIGFANAVLRRLHGDIVEKSEEPVEDPHDRRAVPARHGWCHFRRNVLPSPDGQRSLFLAIKYSHPKWMMNRWLERFGEDEVVALCLENNRVPLVSAILTGEGPSRDEIVQMLEEQEIVVEPGAIETSIRLRRPGDLRQLEAFQEGWLRIQDETAHQIGEALDPPEGAEVLDLCAGPGGKATQILEQIGPDGKLFACDVDRRKLDRLGENLDRVGENYELVLVPRDPRELNLRREFTHILVDAPCSNSGVLARRPEARWRVHFDDFEKLTHLQAELLDAAAAHLAPEGKMVYSTCSIEPEENEGVVSAFLLRNPEFEQVDSRLFLPHRDGSDGGYYAVIQRMG